MNKYNNPRLTNTTIAGSGMKHPVRPHVIIGDPSNGYLLGDLMDANAVNEVVKNGIDEVVGDASEALDTLKELNDALNNDPSFATTVTNALSEKTDKVDDATEGNFAALDENGNLTDSGHKHSDYLTDTDVFETPNANGHEYVDLGLPSGTLWATMNVGATTAEGYGNYYAWGRTTPYSENDAKYDGNEQLYDLTHDAASLIWGGDWHTPTENLILELIQHTKVTTESNYFKYESLNDPTKYIIIPKAGLYSASLPSSTTPSYAGSHAYLWSNINNLGDTSGTTAKFYCPTGTYMGAWLKVHGASVRPVLDGKKPKYVANIYLIQANWSQSDVYAPDFILNKPIVVDLKLATTTTVSDNTTYYPIVGANSSSASTKNIDSTGYKYNSVAGTTSDAGYSTVTLGNGTASGTAGSKRGQLALYDNGTHSNTLNSALLTANRTLSLPDEDGTLATQAYVAANGGSIDVIQVDGVPLTIGANKTVNIELNDRLSAYDSITIETPVNSSDATAPITTLNCAFGRYYRVDVPVETLAINLPEITDNTTVRTFVVFLKWGTTPAITITPDDSEPIYYLEGYEELIQMMVSGDILELNFLWNGGAWIIAGIRILEPTV